MSWRSSAIKEVSDWALSLAIYSSEIAISQLSDGASLILLFEHTLACSTMRNDLLGLQYSLIYLLSIRHRQCLHTENLRSKELELF